jgi:hypothetical protein
MSFIVESQVELFEVKTKGNELYIEGVCMVADVINKNNRLYPKSVMEVAVAKYNSTHVKEMKALGELNHPARPNPDPAEASHIIVEMKMIGEKVYAKAKVLNTPRGQILRGLVEGGWRVQTSSRGLGNLQEKTLNGQKFNEVTDFNITVGFDVVQDQSAPGATMTGVYESIGNDYVNIQEVGEQNADEWNNIFNKMETLTEAKTINMVAELQKINNHLSKAADMADKLYTKVMRLDSGDDRMERVAKNYKVDLNKWADMASRIARTFEKGN